MKGIEPSSFRLTTGCSTIELHMQVVGKEGVEPSSPAYQAGVMHRYTTSQWTTGESNPDHLRAKQMCSR